MLNPAHIIHSCKDKDSFNLAVVNYWQDMAQQAIELRGGFYVALTGGSTPQPIYRLLAQPEYAEQIDWSRVHIYIGDERYVPHDHPDSNYGMARRCLLDHIAIPSANLHPVPTDYASASDAAARYADVLRETISTDEGQIPRFDLIMLGMGDDGHTASLFPGTDILQETDKLVAAVHVEKLNSWRVSMTYPLLNRARQTMVLVSGENKAAILAHVLKEGSEHIYPVQGVNPTGEMHWFIDSAAASKMA